MSDSLAGKLASLPAAERQRIAAALSPDERAALAYTWPFWARPEQLPPAGSWTTWLVLAGRGFGKSRTGAEWIRAEVESGRRGRLALVARTSADVRDVVVEGESGLLAISPPWNRPAYEPSKRRLTWASTGAVATVYSADEPDLLRGPAHDGCWADETASWRLADAVWSNLMFGLRLGSDPRVVVTTTPKPTAFLKRLIADPHTVVTRGRTADNATNLAPTFLQEVVGRYQGTRLGAQELDGLLLEDVQGSLWKRDELDAHRVTTAPELTRVVIALDPSGSSGEHSDACGVVVCGLGVDSHFYVLADYTAVMSPAQWGALAVRLYSTFEADRVVAEVNFGAAMVAEVIRSVRDADGRPVGQNIPFKELHASRSKFARAEPIAALAEQGRLHLVGSLPELEDELTGWEPGSGQRSPNRLDAMVWGVHELLGGSTEVGDGWYKFAAAAYGVPVPAPEGDSK